MNRSILVFFLLLVVTTVGIALQMGTGYAQTETQSAIKVTYPPDEKGIKVGKELEVKGTASIPSDNHLWVLARREDFDPVWWIQREGKIDENTKEWKVIVTFGGPQDIGWNFDIAVIAVNDAEHARLRSRWTEAMKTGNWLPIDMPPTTSRVFRKVKKENHY